MKSYDVVIVGGGVIGGSTAYHLAACGDFDGRVLVIEKDPSYEFASCTRSNGSIRQQFSLPENIAICLYGLDFYRNAHDWLAVDGEPFDLSFTEWGYLFMATEGRVAVMERNNALQRSMGGKAEIVWAEDLPARFPWLNPDGLAAVSFGAEGEGWIDPNTLVQGYRRKARSLGVEYREDEVVGMCVEGGCVAGVELASGEAVACGAVVNAAGYHAGRVAAMAGIDLPVEPRKRIVYAFDCRERIAPMPQCFTPNGVYVRAETGGGYIAGVSPSLDRDAPCWDFEVEYDLFEDVVWPDLAHRFPAFEAIRLRSAWACHYEYNPLDENAIVDIHPEIRNFHFANGFSGHGVQQSPAAGRALAELICHGGFRTIDLSRFNYARIARGEALREEEIVEVF